MLYFPYISRRFVLLSLRGFTKLKKAVIRPVVRGLRNHSEFFSDFLNVYEEKNGLGRLMYFREIEKIKI